MFEEGLLKLLLSKRYEGGAQEKLLRGDSRSETKKTYPGGPQVVIFFILIRKIKDLDR